MQPTSTHTDTYTRAHRNIQRHISAHTARPPTPQHVAVVELPAEGEAKEVGALRQRVRRIREQPGHCMQGS